MSDSSDDRQGENTEGFIRYFFFWLVWVLVVYYCIRSLRFMAGRFGGGTSDDEDYEMTGNNTQDQEQAAATTMLRPNALYGNHHTTRQERRHLIQGALVNNSRAHGNDISRDNAENADHHAENDTGSFIDNTCIICLNDYDEDPDGELVAYNILCNSTISKLRYFKYKHASVSYLIHEL